jgi:CheY-like chemotaxis protein
VAIWIWKVIVSGVLGISPTVCPCVLIHTNCPKGPLYAGSGLKQTNVSARHDVSTFKRLSLLRKPSIIAIVDDDEVVRVAIGRLLQALGYCTALFASADEFLRSEQVGSTSCLITDLHMPGLSGLDLQDRLVARGDRIPIIFITGYPEENARTRAMKAGAVGFLGKPCNRDQLTACVEKALNANWSQSG